MRLALKSGTGQKFIILLNDTVAPPRADRNEMNDDDTN